MVGFGFGCSVGLTYITRASGSARSTPGERTDTSLTIRLRTIPSPKLLIWSGRYSNDALVPAPQPRRLLVERRERDQPWPVDVFVTEELPDTADLAAAVVVAEHRNLGLVRQELQGARVVQRSAAPAPSRVVEPRSRCQRREPDRGVERRHRRTHGRTRSARACSRFSRCAASSSRVRGPGGRSRKIGSPDSAR